MTLSEVSNTFQTIAWDRYAGIAGALTTIVCLGAGAVGCFVNDGFWQIVAALYTVGVGFLIAVIELPALYCHSYACIKFKDRLVEDTAFHHGWIRASLYIACTPAMLGFSSILLWPGIQLLVVAFLYVLVSVKYRINASTTYANLDYSKVNTSEPQDDDGPSFGTFTL
eukprot:CAMPEP_0197428208 /NCGR_PEP_ID=MMETSP1170-20131217/40368_1 /TAXON_ID=54406 /ORGANISM="Sarcinochrysis sp, Strain CCMP770" /LENGTH=167 /DNA_ID=CAMNT_0042955941 /DNA_START=28 /DNA_END=531 /DNA_ORIENTATION=+